MFYGDILDKAFPAVFKKFQDNKEGNSQSQKHPYNMILIDNIMTKKDSNSKD